jgi:hypothetical protein
MNINIELRTRVYQTVLTYEQAKQAEAAHEATITDPAPYLAAQKYLHDNGLWKEFDNSPHTDRTCSTIMIYKHYLMILNSAYFRFDLELKMEKITVYVRVVDDLIPFQLTRSN